MKTATQVITGFILCMIGALVAVPVLAQAPAPSPAAAAQPAPAMKRLSGVWIEGPGYNVTYGSTYDGCAQRCLAASECRMIEYYRPEKKCNLYKELRPQVQGGSSDVGVKN